LDPPFHTAYNGAAGHFDYPAWCVLSPRFSNYQYNNLKYANVVEDSIIEMILIPINYYIGPIRFDVNRYDASMAGATVEITGVRYRVDSTNPTGNWIATEDTFFHTAHVNQAIAPIPLDVPSSTVLYTGMATSVVAADGVALGAQYFKPYYVEPEFVGTGADKARYETGALLLGLKIIDMPTNTDVKIEDALGDFYLST
jgi:hypothetical protein